MCFEGLTGLGVRVAIIDSGVNPAHPHIGSIAGGVSIGPLGESPIYLDQLGHGTAVAAAIQEKAPEALIYAVKVFDRALATSSAIILRAIEWCLANKIHIINLSLGSRSESDQTQLEELAARAARSRVALVAAHAGRLPMTIAVDLSTDCPREIYFCEPAGARNVFYASGYPRPIPGVPPERNLNGISFAVANMTGFVARARQARSDASLEALQLILMENAAASMATIRRDYGQT